MHVSMCVSVCMFARAHACVCVHARVSVRMFAGKSARMNCLCGFYTMELHYYGHPRDWARVTLGINTGNNWGDLKLTFHCIWRWTSINILATFVLFSFPFQSFSYILSSLTFIVFSCDHILLWICWCRGLARKHFSRSNMYVVCN